MEEQQQNQHQNPSEVVQPVPQEMQMPVQEPAHEGATPVSPQQASKAGFKNVLSNLMAKFKAAPKNVKLLVIVVLVFVFSIILLLIAALATKGRSGQKVETVATPTPASESQLLQVEISNPSRYATDSGVLKIESDADNLSKEMDSVDLRQSNLRVPSLDFDIKF